MRAMSERGYPPRPSSWSCQIVQIVFLKQKNTEYNWWAMNCGQLRSGQLRDEKGVLHFGMPWTGAMEQGLGTSGLMDTELDCFGKHRGLKQELNDRNYIMVASVQTTMTKILMKGMLW